MRASETPGPAGGRPLVSRAAVVVQLRALGVRPGGALVVHTSFRAVRPVEGGPLGLIAALREALGPAGTLVLPTMTGSRRAAPYDPAGTPTRGMGVVAETFWRLPGVLRSDHPTASFAAAGPDAARITAPQPLEPVHGPDSPIGRVWALDGQVLLLGVDHTADTTVHLGECLAGAPYRRRKWATVRLEGAPRRVAFGEPDHCGRSFALLDAWLRPGGDQREGAVGHATARLVGSRDVVRVVTERLGADPLRFLCAPGNGCAECDDARQSIPA
jgi:aminoglycoside 3-N-acetyltransferase